MRGLSWLPEQRGVSHPGDTGGLARGPRPRPGHTMHGQVGFAVEKPETNRRNRANSVGGISTFLPLRTRASTLYCHGGYCCPAFCQWAIVPGGPSVCLRFGGEAGLWTRALASSGTGTSHVPFEHRDEIQLMNKSPRIVSQTARQTGVIPIGGSTYATARPAST